MDPNIVVVITIGVVILGSLALWLGRGMKIQGYKWGFTIVTKERKAEEVNKQGINIRVDPEITDSNVGDIVGFKQEGITDKENK